MAENSEIGLPEGFELDTPKAPEVFALPEGFELDKPVERELPEDIELFGQALSEGDSSRFLSDLHSEKIDITRGEEIPVLTPLGVALKGPEDIRREKARKAEDGWAEVVGRSVIQGGLVVPTTVGAASRFLNDALGLDFRGIGPDIPDLYDLAKEADNFWKPSVEQNETKRLAGKIVRTMTEMGTAALFTGGSGMLPSLSASAGLQKFVEAREEGAEFWKAAHAGSTQAAIEYTTEKLPISVLLKPGLSFSRRLMLGLVTDVPGELMATTGEMALVDTQILGKRYTLDQYINSLKETAIVAVGVTGGMTVASHPMIAEIEEFEKEVKSDPETFEAQFQQKLNETAGVKAEPPTPEQLEETKQADIETAKKTFTDLGMDDVTATEEATKIAEQAAKAREVFHQEEIREEPVETITADIAGQLQTTGRFSQEDAELQAEALYGTFFASMAKRVGADPIDLFESYNVSIGRTRATTPTIESNDPVVIADTLGIAYNGFQEGVEDVPGNYLFTDNVTGTTFGVENLRDVTSRLREKRIEFGVEKVPDENILFQSAYHGTPHEFDKFTLAHIGKGEGAQAFGWGLYFAENKDVAKFYKERLANRSQVLYKGEEIDLTDDTPQNVALRAIRIEGNITKAFTRLKGILDSFEKAKFKVASDIQDKQNVESAIKWLNENKKDVGVKRSGKLIKVDLKPKADEWLDWDKPLNKQSAKVKANLNKIKEKLEVDPLPEITKGMSQKHRETLESRRENLLKSLDTFEETGRDFYFALASSGFSGVSESMQDASLALKDAGIPGIRYKDALSRGKFDFVPISDERRTEITDRMNELQKVEIPSATEGEALRLLHEELSRLSGELARADADPTTNNFVVFDEELIEIEEFFQKKKGRIEFGPEGVKIDLLKDADPSTLLHETGHFYLKVLGDLSQSELANQELIDDAQIVADWVGAPDLSVLTRDQSEQFARGFEAYLREGKAPSSALREAFAQFKEWLTEVYQRIRQLNVQLTPEVRGVMDRMLASQEEIEAVQTEIDETVIDLVAEGRDINKITQVELKKHLTPAAKRTIRGQILDVAGKRASFEFIKQDNKLFVTWNKARESARKAVKAGKLEEAAKWKLKMKEVIAKANAKVEKIQTEKQKMAKRRRTISVIKNFLNLTDAQMKGLTGRRNVANMTDWEFKQFKDDLLIRAEQVQETALAKARVMEIIERKQLKKVENYQKSLGLPTIHKMSKKQLDEFVKLLEVFEDADVFLNTRELETVDRTDLKGIRTWREAKERLAIETRASIEDLNAIKVNWTDKFKWDNSLAESNPFYELMVTEMNKKLLQAEARVHEVENEIFRLAKASEKSRGRSITRKLIPQDTQIIAYLEASEDVKPSIAKEMTPEQLDLAHFMGQYFNSALEYLIKTKSLDKGRENYFVHIRRSFLETLKDDGLGSAVMNVFKDYQEQEMVFNILDGDTGNILPLEKFFQFSLRRTGALTPTQNVVKAFLAYSRTFEKKVTLDEAIPKLDIYAQSLTPKMTTTRGLELDRSLKKFVYQYVNNKKGRQIDFGFVKQGDKVDLSIRALRTFTTLLDLGLSLPVGVASFIGEQAANFTMLGEKGVVLGTKRGLTKKGKVILEKYEAFVGRSVWEEFTQPGKEIGERVMEGMFGLFHQATVTANKQFLLASLSKSEYDSSTISDERLAQLRIEMGRFRAIPGAKSLVGSTSPGGAAVQYKSWAVPIVRTVTKDLTTLASDLKNKPTGEALTTREARELFRAIRLSFVAVLVLGFGDREDKTFVGQLTYKARREVLTVLQAISPDMWLSTPRMVGFATQLGKNLESLIMLEEYKTKPGLKGVGGIKRQFTPSVVRQLTPDEERRQRR